jgi:hypothetical protein
MTTHRNSRYEYTTREWPSAPDVLSSSSDKEISQNGWRRVWADVTLEGTFVVYRRERRET